MPKKKAPMFPGGALPPSADMIGQPLTPPAASDLRERARAFLEKTDVEWNFQDDLDRLVAEFAAIRAEAKAEGWDDAVKALRKNARDGDTWAESEWFRCAADRLAANRPTEREE